MANIVHGKPIFPELVQEKATPYNIQNKLNNWLTDQAEYEKIKLALSVTKDILRGDSLAIPDYMSKVIDDDFGKKIF